MSLETRRPRVLVADDEEAIRVMVVRMLRRAGFDPAEAVDGQHAIERLDTEPFDALVLDLMMPRVDGFGVVNHLIDTHPHMMEKTVVITAFPRMAAKEKLHHLCGILSKPFETSELVQLVQERAGR